MRQELDDTLCKKYPQIFADRIKTPQETLMCFGFECGDGWYDIIDTLCYHIQRHVDSKKLPPVAAMQVKEKFGTLRFYTSGGDSTIDSLISMAGDLSAKTCETCGNKGKLYMNGWWYTACDEHTRPGDRDEQETKAG